VFNSFNIKKVATDPRETAFLSQRLSVAVQRFNAACLSDVMFPISEVGAKVNE